MRLKDRDSSLAKFIGLREYVVSRTPQQTLPGNIGCLPVIIKFLRIVIASRLKGGVAIHFFGILALDCFASLAMTGKSGLGDAPGDEVDALGEVVDGAGNQDFVLTVALLFAELAVDVAHVLAQVVNLVSHH